MNTVKRQLSILTLALCAAFAVVTPAATQAQSYSNGPRDATISSFDVRQVQRLRPGSVLSFSLIGTPGATVSLQIAGATKGLQLRETSAGTYEGDYTIRTRDRLTPTSVVTARVLKSGQAFSATLARSLVAGQPDLVTQTVAQINGFNMTAPDGVSPGDELNFSLSGTPGATARVTVQGLNQVIKLSEISRGRYEGSYVIRRQDRLGSEVNAEGFLMQGGRETSQRFQQRFAGGRDDGGRDNRQQAVATCANCGAVESVNVVEVRSDTPNVLGTIAGGVLGGVVGNQVGGGSGKDIATIVGAVGGAYAGNRVQNNMGKSKVFRVTVRLDAGSTQNFDYADDPAVQVGTRVKIDNGALLRL